MSEFERIRDIETVAGKDLKEGMMIYDYMRFRWCEVTQLHVSEGHVLGVKPIVFTGVYGDGQTKINHASTDNNWTVKKDSIPK